MKSFTQLFALSLIAYFTIFSHNEMLNLDVMEARNIVTAREMVSNSNWLLPTMNGEVRLNKPPLPTWITAIPIMLMKNDANLGLLRIPAGTAACLMVYFVFFLTKKMIKNPFVPFLSAAVLATSEFLMIMGRRVSWDIFCHMFMVGAIWLLVSEWKKEKQSLQQFMIAGVFMGLSFLSKGPVAFHSMLLPFFLSYIYVFGGRSVAAKWKGNLLSVITCLLIALAWPLYLYLNLPEISVNAGVAEMQTWVGGQSKPFWYYFSFPIHVGIWVFLMISALLFPLHNNASHVFDDRNNHIFLIVWTLLTVVLLSIVPKKSTHYLLPVIVPASMMVGLYMHHLITVFLENRQTFTDRLVISIHECMLVVLSAGSLALYLYYDTGIHETILLQFILPSTVFIGIAALSMYFFRHRHVFGLFITTIVLVCSFSFFIQPVIRNITHQRSFMVLVKSRADTNGINLPFYSLYQMNIKEIWAVGRSVKRIAVDSFAAQQTPFAFFSKQDPHELFQQLQILHFKVKKTSVYVDNNAHDTWYLSEIDTLE